MNNYKYSIIIPHINEGYLLDITLDSIYNNFKYNNYEIIIVDDGTDNKNDLDFIKKHYLRSKIKVYFKKELGSAKARNYGAKKSNGDFLIFLDSHMYFKEDFLSKLNIILNTKKIDILQPIIGNFQDKQSYGYIYKIKNIGLDSFWSNPKTQNSNLYETPNISGAATIIRKKVFSKIGGFNINFIKWGCEDLELSMRAWLYGFKCYFTSKLFVAHYFKQFFKNTEVKAESICHNKIIFTYTCFKNISRQKKVLQKIEIDYGEKFFKNIYDKIHLNDDFWGYIEKEQKKFKYNDDWYFDKFKDYYLDF